MQGIQGKVDFSIARPAQRSYSKGLRTRKLFGKFNLPEVPVYVELTQQSDHVAGDLQLYVCIFDEYKSNQPLLFGRKADWAEHTYTVHKNDPKHPKFRSMQDASSRSSIQRVQCPLCRYESGLILSSQYGTNEEEQLGVSNNLNTLNHIADHIRAFALNNLPRNVG